MADTPRMDWDNGAGGKFSLSVDTAGIVYAFFENDHRVDNVQIPVEKFLEFADKIRVWQSNQGRMGKCNHELGDLIKGAVLDFRRCSKCRGRVFLVGGSDV